LYLRQLDYHEKKFPPKQTKNLIIYGLDHILSMDLITCSFFPHISLVIYHHQQLLQPPTQEH
jgi:hypothetical protein